MTEGVAALLKLESHLRDATNLSQLYFIIVNETHECAPYTQAILVLGEELKHLKVVAASDISSVDYTSPFMTWVQSLARYLARLPESSSVTSFTPAQADQALRTDWQEMSPQHLLWVPLKVAARENTIYGTLLLFRSEPWIEGERFIMEHLAGTMAHALFALQRTNILRSIINSAVRQRKLAILFAILVGLSMWLPVRLTALAPTEVIPKDPLAITSPVNGAIKQVEVVPNQIVKTGDLLVQFDDTELAGELEVAMQALLVAQAELRTVQQSSFLNPAVKIRLAELEARVRLQQAELEFVRSRFEKTRLTSPGNGIAILTDPNDWQGRPVAIGERILQIADPQMVELQIMLPVKDSIALRQGAEVNVFFDSDPLHARPAIVQHAEYEPKATAEGVLAYRLIAKFSDTADSTTPPRIGTRGTAKVFGQTVPLYFYLFRRPITTLRQRLGW